MATARDPALIATTTATTPFVPLLPPIFTNFRLVVTTRPSVLGLRSMITLRALCRLNVTPGPVPLRPKQSDEEPRGARGMCGGLMKTLRVSAHKSRVHTIAKVEGVPSLWHVTGERLIE
jgi:hypothetical protein